MEHSKHIIRAVLLLVVITVVLVVVRHFCIPATFGEVGHYRQASVAEFAAKPAVLGRRGSCAGCHDFEAEIAAEGSHAPVPCEVCHAPLATHVEEGEYVAEMPVSGSYERCAWCHRSLKARPPSFPQIVLGDHVIDKGGELTPEVCLECHDAHDPGT